MRGEIINSRAEISANEVKNEWKIQFSERLNKISKPSASFMGNKGKKRHKFMELEINRGKLLQILNKFRKLSIPNIYFENL